MEQKIPPRTDWPTLSYQQLMQAKFDLEEIYWNLVRINRQVAENYLKLSKEAEYIANIKLQEEQQRNADDY